MFTVTTTTTLIWLVACSYCSHYHVQGTALRRYQRNTGNVTEVHNDARDRHEGIVSNGTVSYNYKHDYLQRHLNHITGFSTTQVSGLHSRYDKELSNDGVRENSFKEAGGVGRNSSNSSFRVSNDKDGKVTSNKDVPILNRNDESTNLKTTKQSYPNDINDKFLDISKSNTGNGVTNHVSPNDGERRMMWNSTNEVFESSNESSSVQDRSISSRGMKMPRPSGNTMQYLLVPGFLMAGILPWIMPKIQMIAMMLSMINNMAFTSALFGLIRNYIFEREPAQHVLYINNGYNKKNRIKERPVHGESHHHHEVVHYTDQHGGHYLDRTEGSKQGFEEKWRMRV